MNGNIHERPEIINIARNVKMDNQVTQQGFQHRSKIQKLALAFGVYFLFNALIFSYTFFYFYWLIPNSIKMEVNLEKVFTFTYNRSYNIFITHLIGIFPAIFISLLLVVQWIIVRITNYLVRNESRKICIRNAVENTISTLIILAVLNFLDMNRFWKLTICGIYTLVFIKICFSGSSISQKLIRVLMLLIYININILEDDPHTKSISLMEYLASNNNVDAGNYKSFLSKYNFKTYNVTVFASEFFAAASSVRIGSYSMIAICDNLFNPLHFDMFRAVFLHELGHCNLHHSHILFACMALFAISILGYLVTFLRKSENNTVKKYAECMRFVFTVAIFLEIPLNSFSQLLEFQADDFASKLEPQLVKNLIFSLLAHEKLPDAVFLNEHIVNLTVKSDTFIYPTFHPFYTHPSVFERMKRLSSMDEQVVSFS
ncbi:uncharacterized protein VICG_00690 [Vittaforma corneae ATCC 50505]|uniref:Peptidase M48 domain-containing protein n=1 Tax=Vittaforma corneae (strain ATCC 50505) TaxID=993615 RepID=L2GP47_VITCO|nr:uncharacterized protein VICG_00690 [Vittaforma corneae ATCC 50505]ELA42290.1 hypothetical protein VICG_00690 [Vittaforma corneae ATCC 50505]